MVRVWNLKSLDKFLGEILSGTIILKHNLKLYSIVNTCPYYDPIVLFPVAYPTIALEKYTLREMYCVMA